MATDLVLLYKLPIPPIKKSFLVFGSDPPDFVNVLVVSVQVVVEPGQVFQTGKLEGSIIIPDQLAKAKPVLETENLATHHLDKS